MTPAAELDPIDALVRPGPGRIRVVGILNVTPDSFSDGGRWADLEAAVDHGRAMAARGAALVDVGGESTRPGAVRIDAAEEQRRVMPVVAALCAAGIAVSIDTTRSSVAAAALAAGAVVVNDVSGGTADPEMASVVADAGCPWILMHSRAFGGDMQSRVTVDDVVSDVVTELGRRVDAAVSGGVDPGALVVDPGIGFAKTAAQNWQLLARLDALRDLGYPVLVGASRKAFLGELLADELGAPRPLDGREDATAAITTFASMAGVWGVRVHDVGRSIDAARTVAALVRAGAEVPVSSG